MTQNMLNLARATVRVVSLAISKDGQGRPKATLKIFQPSSQSQLIVVATDEQVIQSLLHHGKTNLWRIVLDRSNPDEKRIVQAKYTTTPAYLPA